jgi:Fic family protein
MSDNVVKAVNEKGESLIVFEATPPYLVKPEIEAAITWTINEINKKELHPILIISNFIFEFLAIHPFSDGNGRLSRALTNLLLLQADYAYIPYVSIDEIIEDTRSKYYIALNKTQNKHRTNNEDITPWLNYLLDILLTHTEKARKLMQGEHPEMFLSESQEKILSFFKNDESLSISDISEKLHDDASRETTKKILARLVELRLIELIGRGRGARYKKSSNNKSKTP